MCFLLVRAVKAEKIKGGYALPRTRPPHPNRGDGPRPRPAMGDTRGAALLRRMVLLGRPLGGGDRPASHAACSSDPRESFSRVVRFTTTEDASFGRGL